jgi:hypothetical protein
MYLQKKQSQVSSIFSSVGLVVNMCLSLVPFGQLVDVVRTGVVEVFPLPLTFCGCVSSFLWCWYSKEF